MHGNTLRLLTGSLARGARGLGSGLLLIVLLACEPPVDPLPPAGDAAAAERHRLRASELRRAGADKSALRDAYEAALRADPTHQPTLLEFGFFLLETLEELNYGKALQLFQAVRQRDPAQPLALCGEAVARAETGDTEGAEPLLRRAVTLPEVQADAGLLALAEASLGQLAFQRGDTRAARQHLSRAAELTPRRSRFQVQYGAFLYAEGDHEEAEQVMREAIKRTPTDVTAHYHLYLLLRRRGATEEARRERRIHEILRQFADHTASFQEADVEGRLALRRELVTLFPEYDRARLVLVRELINLQRHEPALREIDAEEEQRGPTAETRYLRARCLAGSGRLDEARELVERMNPTGERREVLVQLILEEWRTSQDIEPRRFAEEQARWKQGQP